jgi:hypothetical protein
MRRASKLTFRRPSFSAGDVPLPRRVHKQNTRSNIVYLIEKYVQKIFVARKCMNKMYFGACASAFIFAQNVLSDSLK